MQAHRYIMIVILALFSAVSYGKQITFPDNLDREWENRAFSAGERFRFDIDYAFITAGHTEMKIDSIIDVRGHSCYRVSSLVSSNKAFDVVFKVRDYVETNIDTKGLFSRRYFKQLREGGYRDKKEVFFEQEQGAAHIFSKGIYQKSVKLPSCSQDILSAMYFMRTVEIEVGDTLSVPLHDVSKSYPLKIKVKRRETVKVPAGEFNCLVVEPFLESEGMFRSKGKIEVWLSDDERKLPVLMRTYIKIIGHIDARLAEYELGTLE